MSDGATRREPTAWRQPAARRFSFLGTSKTLRFPRMAINVFVYDENWVLDGKKDHDHVSPSDLVAKSEKK